MIMQLLQDMVVFSAEWTLFLGAMICLMIGTYHRGEDSYHAVQRAVLAVLLIALGCTLCAPAVGDISFGLHFTQTAATQFAKVVILSAGLGALLLSQHGLARIGAQRFEYPVLILLATLGMCLMVSARDLMALYVAIELQSLALYIMAAFARQDEKSTEAGLKYFVLGALSSGLLLYGMSMVYGTVGAIHYDAIATAMAAGPLGLAQTVALVFILAALAFKVSAAPFHMWTPDVYQGAPTPITAFFITAPKVAGAMVLVQMLHGPFAAAGAAWGQIIWAAAALSLLVGGFAAIMQSNLKRLLAYSTINHVGFLLLAILAGGLNGYAALLVYLAVYVVISVGTFSAILFLQQQGETVETLDDLRGLGARAPRTAMALAVMMFAAAGVPPTAGFLGKLYVLLAAMDAGLVWLAAFGVITSVVATFYYLRIIKLMYFDEAPAPVILPKVAIVRRLALLVALSVVLILGWMIMPQSLVGPATHAARTIGLGN